MNVAQIHLSLNHLPVVLPFVGVGLLIAGLSLRSLHLKTAALVLFILAAILAIPSYLTGEPAETLLKNYPGVSRAAMHEHEKSAKLSLIAVEASGVVALIASFLLFKKKRVPAIYWGGLLALVGVVCVLMLRTAHMGGVIRHEEIQTPEERTRFDAG